MGRSIRTERWRYTEWTNGMNETVAIELYDEQTDAKDIVNLAMEPAHQAIATRLAVQLRAGRHAEKQKAKR